MERIRGFHGGGNEIVLLAILPAFVSNCNVGEVSGILRTFQQLNLRLFKAPWDDDIPHPALVDVQSLTSLSVLGEIFQDSHKVTKRVTDKVVKRYVLDCNGLRDGVFEWRMSILQASPPA